MVELDGLPRAELSRVRPVLDREPTDGSQLLRGDTTRWQLDPQHERPDLRLVVVEAPPLEPDQILLRDVGVTRCDQCGELTEHPERALLSLEPLDRVPLEDEFQRRLRRRGPALTSRGRQYFKSYSNVTSLVQVTAPSVARYDRTAATARSSSRAENAPSSFVRITPCRSTT